MAVSANPRVLHLRSSGALLGAEQVVLSLCHHSREYGYEAALAVTRDSGDAIPALFLAAEQAGIPASLIECRRSLDWRALTQLRELVSKLEIDILHCHGYREDFYAVFSRTAAKLVTTNHLWKRTTLALRMYARLDAMLMRRFDRVVGVSSDIYNELSTLGIEASRLAYVPNGIDVQRFEPRRADGDEQTERRAGLGLGANDLVLATAGSLTEEKGHRFVLHALASGRAALRKVVWLVIGDGPQAESLRRLTSELGLEQQVRFLGRREDVAEILSIVDIFVLPSLVEGLPIALLEAMAAEVACVATRVGDVSSVIESGTNGVLIERAAHEALAEALVALEADSGLRRRLARNARQLVLERYSSSRMAQGYCELYDELLA